MSTGATILRIAQEFEGLVEVRSNAEWDDPKTPGKDKRAVQLADLLKRAGHQDGWPYCMSFCEGVWRAAYEEVGSHQVERISRLLNPHVISSFNACRAEGLISREPQPGAIMFMQSGQSSSGHAGLVLYRDDGWIFTIEANTSPSGQHERDGGIGTGGIWRKKRLLSFVPRATGLWIRGFLNPMTP